MRHAPSPMYFLLALKHCESVIKPIGFGARKNEAQILHLHLLALTGVT